LNHWPGRATAADRNDGGLLAQPRRFARQFGFDGEDGVVGTVRDLPAACHRDQRFPGSSGHGGAHRPVANSCECECQDFGLKAIGLPLAIAKSRTSVPPGQFVYVARSPAPLRCEGLFASWPAEEIAAGVLRGELRLR